MDYCQHLATSESPPCLPPTKRPCTWHPKSGPRAWEFSSPAAAAAWAVGTAQPEGNQEGAETRTPQPDVTGEARTGESQVVKSEHFSGESGDEGLGPEADAKPDRKRYAKRISSTIKEWYLSFQAVKERDGWTRARVLRFASSAWPAASPRTWSGSGSGEVWPSSRGARRPSFWPTPSWRSPRCCAQSRRAVFR